MSFSSTSYGRFPKNAVNGGSDGRFFASLEFLEALGAVGRALKSKTSFFRSSSLSYTAEKKKDERRTDMQEQVELKLFV